LANKRRILVVCGTAIATSTVVAKKVEELLSKRGIAVETRQCKAAEIRSNLDGVDLIVATTPIPKDINVPSVRGLAFLTGVGEDDAVKEILQKLGMGQ
jgi:PTS system galactitol-specific IIB component